MLKSAVKATVKAADLMHKPAQYQWDYLFNDGGKNGLHRLFVNMLKMLVKDF